MAHFAQIDEDGVVLQVIVVDDSDCLNQYGVESEEIGALFCHKLLGGTWLQTSISGSARKNFAGIGFRYDADRDAFIAPRPSDDWVFDEVSCTWVNPNISAPEGDQ